MQIRTLKIPSKRIEAHYNSGLNLVTYGHNNLYPQQVATIVATSAIGSACIKRYADFIEGRGFRDEQLAALELNRFQETADDILAKVAHDVGMYGGLALHVNYDLGGNVVEVQHVPFENCRLEEPDEDGVVHHILLHPDWTQQRTRAGQRLWVNSETVDRIPVFNLDSVREEMLEAGGIGEYQGQILYISNIGANEYAIPRYDCILTELSIDEGISNVKYRNVRNNFLPAGMLITKQGQMAPEGDSGDSDKEFANFMDDFIDFQGDEKSCNIIGMNVASEEEVPEFRPFEVQNFDKQFETTESSTEGRIYACFGQEAFYCIKQGKVGFGGDVVTDAYSLYNSVTGKERRLIERAFTKVLSGSIFAAADCSIEPIRFEGVSAAVQQIGGMI